MSIESHFFYLASKYADNDITIIYQYADMKQLYRLKNIVRCIKYEGQEIECEKAFFCFNREIWNNVKGKKYIVLHGDYKDMVARGQLSKSLLPIEKDCDGYLGVSQAVCDSFEELTGIKVFNVGNPFLKVIQRKILRLVYCGRLSSEKGGNRIDKLLQALDQQGVKYQLFVYSNGTITNKNVIQMPIQLDVARYLNKFNYDFLLQLSDNEGYCYSVVEALSNGLPVITTPIPVFKEIGLNDSNSITMNFDCSNMDEVIDKALYKSFNFVYEAPEDKWQSVLAKGKNTYKGGIMEYRVKAKKKFESIVDSTIGRARKENEVFTVDELRKDILLNADLITVEECIENAVKEQKDVKKAVKRATKRSNA